jgi:hypothetical protein
LQMRRQLFVRIHGQDSSSSTFSLTCDGTRRADGRGPACRLLRIDRGCSRLGPGPPQNAAASR